jgi:hypothetical protein
MKGITGAGALQNLAEGWGTHDGRVSVLQCGRPVPLSARRTGPQVIQLTA